MGSALRRWVVGALLLSCCAATACTPAPEPKLLVRDDRPARSQQVVDEVVGRSTNPGCAAAVGARGDVVWQGQRGLAVVEPETPITADTPFNIGTVAKQFTALSVALLAEEGRLSLDDTVAEHLDGYPDWAGKVTLNQLIHHTSGIPRIESLMEARAISTEAAATQADLLRAIAGAETVDFEPGSRWSYSSSNYLLLGAIVERLTGRSLAEHLDQTYFAPLGLRMSLEWPGPADRTRSYRGEANGEFEIADVGWDGAGASDIRTTPGELVRWADVYRTGVIGGSLVMEPSRDTVEGAFDGSRYGLGIMITPDNVLWHGGDAGAFHSIFGVSADRETAIAVTCNSFSIDPYDVAGPLIEIWDPQ